MIKIIKKIKSSMRPISAFFLFSILFFVKIIARKKIIFLGITANRIGHLAAETELFLRRLNDGIKYKKDNAIYIGVCLYFPISNRQLLNMYKRHLLIIENKIFARIIDTWIKHTQFYIQLPYQVDEYYEFNKIKSILFFIPREIDKGKNILTKMGINGNSWFVCFHSRDSKYLGKGSEYHNYRDSNINNYLMAAEYIVEQGGYAIRIGSIVDKPLPKKRHPHILDYALDCRSDFMDIYLLSHCKFLLGNTAGIFVVSSIFNVPVACANWVPLGHTPLRKGDLFIPKKLYSIKKEKYLSYKEIILLNYERYFESDKYKNANISVIENTSEEILDLTKEMHMRLNNDYKSDQELSIQKRYRSLFEPHHVNCISPVNIATSFIERNTDLFPDINNE